MIIKSGQICFVTLLVFAVATWASQPVGPSTLQGDVKDSKLQPVAGAEVHIQAKDGSGFMKIVRTDANGHYVVSKLSNTNYEVVLFINGSIKASISNTKTYADKPTQLDFKLTGQYAGNRQKKHTHMVYMPGETGSHLGGRWVEVDDNGNANTAGADNLQKADGTAIRHLQNTTTGGTSAMGGGH
jgi:hypothetical protein